MHLDADTAVIRDEAQEEFPAWRYAVQQGVGGEFADAQQDVVLAPMDAPLIKRPARERTRVGHGPALTAEEALTWGRG